jgi:hydrogenase nickel incorporation protein HypA/HybF
MHEWALAESIITAMIEEAKKERLKKIIEIIISIGELQQIEQDIFEFAFKQVLKEQKKEYKNLVFSIETEECSFKCKSCDNIWTFDELKKSLNQDESEAIHFLPEIAFVHNRCSICGSPDFEIISGRGVSIKSIKGVK